MITLLIAGMAIMLARMTATQAVAFSLDERGIRAYWAARAGLEWASYQLARGGSVCAASAVAPIPSGATSLSNYQVTVTCSGSGPHLLTATAICVPAECGGPGSATYVERAVTRTMP